MNRLFSNNPELDARLPIIIPEVEKYQDWVTPAIEAFWKAYEESGYANKCRETDNAVN